MSDLGTARQHSGTIDAGGGWDEVMILPSDFEALESAVFSSKTFGVIEPDVHAVAVSGGLAKQGAGVFDVFSVSYRFGGERETGAHSLFVGRMHVRGIADVCRDSHAGVDE